jgi:LmbE family N-acetylglucosaminyl deacetylase
MSKPTVLAIAAHPDDIEFMMAGTLLQLGRAGCELHVMNIANGSCGTAVMTREAIIEQRGREAVNAAGVLGARHHPPIVDDIDILYNKTQIKQVAAIVREVRPDIMLIPSPEDYMEDHTIACRLAVTAGFVRGMRNYTTNPQREPVDVPVTLYHALPHGLRDGMRRIVRPGMYADITDVMAEKRAALACHASQRDWLDESQGLDSYVLAMEEMSREVGRWSVLFEFAEGWRRHSHLGFCGPDDDPLREVLGPLVNVDEDYERRLRNGR